MALSGWRLRTQNIHLRQCLYHALEALASLWQNFFVVPDCCTKIEVRGGGQAKEKQSSIFTTYSMERDHVNGHPHYTSLDGSKAIAFNLDNNDWKIQPEENR